MTGSAIKTPVQDLQRECLTRSAELSTLVDTLLARVRRATTPACQLSVPDASTHPPVSTQSAVAPPTADLPTEESTLSGDPDAVQRVLAEADEWLVGAESLSERTSASTEAEAFGSASSCRDSTLVGIDSGARVALEKQLKTLEQRLAKAVAETETQARARATVQQELDKLRTSTAHRPDGSNARHGMDETWEPLWHPTAEAAIASARQGEAEARRQLDELRKQLALCGPTHPPHYSTHAQEQPAAVPEKQRFSTSDVAAVEHRFQAESIYHDLGRVNAADLNAAASVASAAFSTLSAAASSSDPNDPRNAVSGTAAGVDAAAKSLQEVFLQWAPLLQLQCSPVAEQPARRRCDSTSSEDGVMIEVPAARPSEADLRQS
eukprot:COSAG02_NODE_2886_length_7814_cov_3.379123_7_plen_379_part_00